MRWSFVGVGAIVAGLVGLSVLLLFQDITTKNEQDYYLLKETSQGAMLDAVDLTYYRSTGGIKIVKEKFIENFIRRYAQNASLNAYGYDIEFYDIIEVPPKVSVRIKSKSNTISINTESTDFDIINQLDAILETTYKVEDVFDSNADDENKNNDEESLLDNLNHDDIIRGGEDSFGR